LAESTQTDLPDPENGDAEMYIREQIIRRKAPAPVSPSDQAMPTYDELGL
jgi:hypothetical protein